MIGYSTKGLDYLTLEVFSNSDWASCLDIGKSVRGYLLLFGSLLLARNLRHNQLFLGQV